MFDKMELPFPMGREIYIYNIFIYLSLAHIHTYTHTHTHTRVVCSIHTVGDPWETWDEDQFEWAVDRAEYVIDTLSAQVYVHTFTTLSSLSLCLSVCLIFFLSFYVLFNVDVASYSDKLYVYVYV